MFPCNECHDVNPMPPTVLFTHQHTHTAQGEFVITAGEEGDSMYFINSGSVSVLVDGMEIDRKGIGGFFGEAALVLKQVMSSSCVYVR
jgi:CRP-like cAMP-binding protein